jgi:hypothetical protein
LIIGLRRAIESADEFWPRRWGSSLTCDPGPLPLRLALVAALDEWLLVLVIGLCWLFLLARLARERSKYFN